VLSAPENITVSHATACCPATTAAARSSCTA
jgi:hypothetical protein